MTTPIRSTTPRQTDSVAEIIELYKRDVDRSLLRRQLDRTAEDRFRDVMERQRLVEELQAACRAAERSR